MTAGVTTIQNTMPQENSGKSIRPRNSVITWFPLALFHIWRNNHNGN